MTKISALSDIGTSVASNDTFVLVDVSDPTTPNKKIQQQNLLAAGGLLPDGSAGTPGLSFLSDTNVGLFRPTTDTLAIATGGSERLRIDSSGRLGLGTSTASSRCEIDATGGAASATGATTAANANIALASVNGLGTQTKLYAGVGSSDYVWLQSQNGNTTRNICLNPVGGSVGIGTTSPVNKLDVAGSNGTISINTIGDEIVYSRNGTNYLTATGANATIRIQASGASGTLVFGTAGSERARIDSSGRLLVGTSTSITAFGTNLQIAGASEAASSQTNVRFSADALSPFVYLAKSRGATVGTNTIVQDGDDLGVIGFYGATGTTYSPAALITGEVDGEPGTAGDATDMPGRLVFSTTADGASSPTERMRIDSAGTVNSYTNTSFQVRTARTAAAALTALNLYDSASSTSTGTLQFSVLSNGNVQNTNNSYGAISDRKLKENIADASSQWSDIKTLQVRKYNFKEETGYNTHTQIGLIAQEVELVSPGLVSESPDLDAEGNDLGTVTKSVNYSVLYMKAVKALQEAMERIETLEAKVAALEAA